MHTASSTEFNISIELGSQILEAKKMSLIRPMQLATIFTVSTQDKIRKQKSNLKHTSKTDYAFHSTNSAPFQFPSTQEHSKRKFTDMILQATDKKNLTKKIRTKLPLTNRLRKHQSKRKTPMAVKKLSPLNPRQHHTTIANL
ncbi:hypothetical protein KC19_12G048200 [Ceratodon purpureus]|uniref:Uncharacterized protein n=1 Tax=Ceratodon purpureus TaxID=3225 RepID=A0A8T0G632_CERPU|nr:hypothetical protein KC19_12G048200 [Ceratodon purpureus]